MLKKLLWPLLLSLALPIVAHADDDITPKVARDRAGTGLGWYGMYVADMKTYGATTPTTSLADDPSKCSAVIAQYASLIGPDDVIASRDFKSIDGATLVPDSGYPPKYGIAFKDAQTVCDRYADLRTIMLAVQPLEQIYDGIDNSAAREGSFDVLDWYLIGKGEMSMANGSDALVADCDSAIDTAIRAGAKADLPIKFNKTEDLTLDQLRTRCHQRAADANAWTTKATAWAKAKYDSVVKKYASVGIKGARLDLFVYEDGGGWLLPGCASSVDDPKQLKKAKKLFQWLTADDGTITVRKYTFKGDKFTKSEKAFSHEEAAYRACK